MIICLDSFSKQFFRYLGYISTYISLSDDCHDKICKFTALSSDSFCQNYRVTDEALLAETALWPNFFLMNVFFALKGSKLFIIIQYIEYFSCHTSDSTILVILFYLIITQCNKCVNTCLDC